MSAPTCISPATLIGNQAIFVDESNKCGYCHRLTVFEQAADAQPMGNSIGFTPRTEHLEGVQRNDAITEIRQGEEAVAIEPLASSPSRCRTRRYRFHVRTPLP